MLSLHSLLYMQRFENGTAIESRQRVLLELLTATWTMIIANGMQGTLSLERTSLEGCWCCGV